MKYPKERAITDLHTPTSSSDIEAQSHKHNPRHFLDFKPHFRLNEDQYDVIVALLKAMEKCTAKKMKNEGKLLARSV